MTTETETAVAGHVKRACEILGGQIRVAEACAASAAQVNQWTKGVRPVPATKAAAIERATGGAVTRIELRPIDWHHFWPELAERHPDLIPRTAQQAG